MSPPNYNFQYYEGDPSAALHNILLIVCVQSNAHGSIDYELATFDKYLGTFLRNYQHHEYGTVISTTSRILKWAVLPLVPSAELPEPPLDPNIF